MMKKLNSIIVLSIPVMLAYQNLESKEERSLKTIQDVQNKFTEYVKSHADTSFLRDGYPTFHTDRCKIEFSDTLNDADISEGIIRACLDKKTYLKRPFSSTKVPLLTLYHKLVCRGGFGKYKYSGAYPELFDGKYLTLEKYFSVDILRSRFSYIVRSIYDLCKSGDVKNALYGLICRFPIINPVFVVESNQYIDLKSECNLIIEDLSSRGLDFEFPWYHAIQRVLSDNSSRWKKMELLCSYAIFIYHKNNYDEDRRLKEFQTLEEFYTHDELTVGNLLIDVVTNNVVRFASYINRCTNDKDALKTAYHCALAIGSLWMIKTIHNSIRKNINVNDEFINYVIYSNIHYKKFDILDLLIKEKYITSKHWKKAMQAMQSPATFSNYIDTVNYFLERKLVDEDEVLPQFQNYIEFATSYDIATILQDIQTKSHIKYVVDVDSLFDRAVLNRSLKCIEFLVDNYAFAKPICSEIKLLLESFGKADLLGKIKYKEDVNQ